MQGEAHTSQLESGPHLLKLQKAHVQQQRPAEPQKKISRKTSTSALLTPPKPLTVDHNKLWTILQEMGIPDHLTCLLRNLYAGQEAAL